MYKRLLALLLAFVMVFALLPVSAFAEGEGQDGADGEPQAAANGQTPGQLIPLDPIKTEEPQEGTEELVPPGSSPNQGELPPPSIIKPAEPTESPSLPIIGGDISDVIRPVERPNARLNVSVNFDPESTVSDAEAPVIDVYVRRSETDEPVASAELTCENGRAATLYLEPGKYNIIIFAPKHNGNNVEVEHVYGLEVEAGQQYNISRTVKYFDTAILRVELHIAEGVTVLDNYHFVIGAYVYDGDSFVNGIQLDSTNGFSGTMKLRPGSYTLKFPELYNSGEYKYAAIGPVEFTVEAGGEITIGRTLQYAESEKETGSVTVSLEFDPEGPVTEAEAPVFFANIWAGDTFLAQEELSCENRHTAVFELEPGVYDVKFGFVPELVNGHMANRIENVKGLVVEANEQYSVSRAVSFEPAGALRVQLNIAEDSTVSADEIDSILVRVSDGGPTDFGYYLDASDNFCIERGLAPGNYTVSFKLPDFGANACSIEPVEITVEAGKTCVVERTVKYADAGYNVYVEVEVDPESTLTDAEIPEIYVQFYDVNEYSWLESKALTYENGRRAGFKLAPGEYNISFAVFSADGNMAKIEDVRGFVVEEGETYSVSRTVKYETATTVCVKLNIAEGVTVPDEDHFSMGADVYDCDGIFVEGVLLDSSTGFCGEMALLPGSYTLKFEEYYNLSGYEYEEIEAVEFTVEAGKDLTIERELKYIDLSARATVNVELDFDPESTVSDAEAPEIEVEVRRYETDEPVASAELTYENGRAATFHLKPGKYNIIFYAPAHGSNDVEVEHVYELELEAGGQYSISRTVKYFAAAILRVKLNIAEGVTVSDADHFLMAASVYGLDGFHHKGTLLYSENDFCGEIVLLPGSYTLKFEEFYNFSEYEYEAIEAVEFTVEAGEDLTIERELKYIDLSARATVNIEMGLDPESTVSDAEAPEFYANIWAGNDLVAQKVLSYENGRKASLTLKPGEYRISFDCSVAYGNIANAIEDATLTVEAGETYNISRSVKYELAGVLELKLTFDEDSSLSPEEAGTISAIVWNHAESSMRILHLDMYSDFSAKQTLRPGDYTVFFEADTEGTDICEIEPAEFSLAAGEEVLVERTVKFERYALLELEIGLAEDSALSSMEDIIVYATVYNPELGQARPTLNSHNGFRAQVWAPEGGTFDIEYTVIMPDGYAASLSKDTVTLEKGKVTHVYREIKEQIAAKVNIELVFAEDSCLGADLAGPGRVEIYDENWNGVVAYTLHEMWDYKVTANLLPGTYYLMFQVDDMITYVCTGVDSTVRVTVEAGKEYNVKKTAKYVEGAIVTCRAAFAPDSEFFGDDETFVWFDFEWEGEWFGASTSSYNDWMRTIIVPAGELRLHTNASQVDGYSHTAGRTETYYFEPGKTYDITQMVKYVSKDTPKGTVKFELLFDEDSPIQSEDLGTIKVNFKDSTGQKFSRVLTSAADRSAEIELYPGNYTVSFEGTAVEGYSTNLELMRKIVCKSGETTELVYTAMYNKIQQEGDNTGPKPLPGVGTGNSGDSPIKPADPKPSPAPTVPDPFNPPVITPIYPDDNKRGEEIELPGGIIVNAPDAEQSDAITVSYPDKEAEAEQGISGGEIVSGQSEKAAAAFVAAPTAHGAEATGSDTGDAGSIGILAISAAGMLALGAAALLVSKKRKEEQ